MAHEADPLPANAKCYLFPLDRRRRLGSHVEGDPVDTAALIGNAR